MLRRFLTAFSIIALLTGAVFTVLPQAAHAEEKKAASAFTDKQLSELNALIKQVILDNPQTLITSVEGYYNKQNDTKKAQEGSLDQIPAGLYDDPATPYAGDKNAKFIVVEFFDYNCGYCKQVAPDLDRLLKEEKNIKVLFKELPILSDSSEVAARYALAANAQGKYLVYHNALMGHQGPLNEGVLETIAKENGLDADKLKKDAETQEVRDTLGKNLELARVLGIRGTPFFLIGKSKVPGAIGYSRMKEMIGKERDGVTTPTAPTPEPAAPAADVKADAKTDAAPAAAAVEPSESLANDPDMQAAIQDAKKETNDLLRDLNKQAEDLKKAAEEMAKRDDAAKAKAAAEKK